jgi:hypothetical protein
MKDHNCYYFDYICNSRKIGEITIVMFKCKKCNSIRFERWGIESSKELTFGEELKSNTFGT